MWEFISGIKPPQKRKKKFHTAKKCLKSLYYLNKWVFKMNNYSFLSECFDFSFTSTEKILTPKNFVGPLEFQSVTQLAPGKKNS